MRLFYLEFACMFIKVKICGITNIEDARISVDYGADAIGFVFYPQSSRYISPDEAEQISTKMPPFVSIVGVFVDAPFEFIKEVKEKVKLDVIQLHGNESPDFCKMFDCKVIKAFRVQNAETLDICKNYPNVSWLLDAFNPDLVGGTGKVFDWQIALKAQLLNPRIILSGGLTAENVADAIQKVKPMAVDVSSGVEKSPGKKDHQKVKAFIKATKLALIES